MESGGFTEEGFLYNGQTYKKPRMTNNGYVAIKAFSWWHYFEHDETTGIYIKFAQTLKLAKDIKS